MATANTLAVSPVSVPAGSQGTITWSFALNPGTPDANVTVQELLNGKVAQSSTVTLKGQPGEAEPQVVINGNTGVGWELRLVPDPNAPGAGKLTAGSTHDTALISY